MIVDTLWPLVQQGRLAIPRGGYLVRRGHGRIIVEPEAMARDVRHREGFGTVLDRLLIEGQVHGEVARGAGQALLKNALYDEEGHVPIASFMDYAMPRAVDFCNFQVKTNAVPTAAKPRGVKGVGEASAVGALPTAMNAVALASRGIDVLDVPPPLRVWTAIREARSAWGT